MTKHYRERWRIVYKRGYMGIVQVPTPMHLLGHIAIITKY